MHRLIRTIEVIVTDVHIGDTLLLNHRLHLSFHIIGEHSDEPSGGTLSYITTVVSRDEDLALEVQDVDGTATTHVLFD